MLDSRLAIGGALFLVGGCSYEPLDPEELLSCTIGHIVCLDSLPGDIDSVGGDTDYGFGDLEPPGDADVLVPVAFGPPTPDAFTDAPRIIGIGGQCDGDETGMNATLTLTGVEPPATVTCTPTGVFTGVVTLSEAPGTVTITIGQTAAGGGSTSDQRTLTLVTTLPPPVSAPAVVEQCEEALLSWTEPAAIVEVMVVQFDGAPPDGAPNGGAAYSVPNAIGSGTVVGFGTGAQLDVTGLTEGDHYFAIFTRDALFNWSTGVTQLATVSAWPSPDPLDSLTPVAGAVEPPLFTATLTWAAPTPAPASGYEVELYRDECAGVPFLMATTTGLTEIFSSLAWGHYYWRVRSLANGLCDVGQFSACEHFLVSRPPTTPLVVTAIADLKGDHTCVLLDDRAPRCWGFNDNGQLGLGHINSWGDEAGEMGVDLPRVDLGGEPAVIHLGGGSKHVCALLGDGAVKCWGDNLRGQLGIPGGDRGKVTSDMGAALPTLDFGGRVVVALVGGGLHTCALFANEGLECWGLNQFGQTGAGRADTTVLVDASLADVDLGAGVLQVVAGRSHTCVLLTDQNVKCWGRNTFGQLGVGDTTDRGALPGDMGSALQAVPLGAPATALSAGSDHTCALLDDSTVKCWGRNSDGQLGIDSMESISDEALEPPVAAILPAPVVAVSAGEKFTCALFGGAASGEVACWGGNLRGQLGIGLTVSIGDEPGEMAGNLTMVPLAGSVARLHAMRGHVCVLLTNDDLHCWGTNWNGQLGIGNTDHQGDAANEVQALIPIDVGTW